MYILLYMEKWNFHCNSTAIFYNSTTKKMPELQDEEDEEGAEETARGEKKQKRRKISELSPEEREKLGQDLQDSQEGKSKLAQKDIAEKYNLYLSSVNRFAGGLGLQKKQQAETGEPHDDGKIAAAVEQSRTKQITAEATEQVDTATRTGKYCIDKFSEMARTYGGYGLEDFLELCVHFWVNYHGAEKEFAESRELLTELLEQIDPGAKNRKRGEDIRNLVFIQALKGNITDALLQKFLES